MKLTAIFTAILIASAPAFAETKVIEGCLMKPIEGTNAWQKVYPSCDADTTGAQDRAGVEKDECGKGK